MINIHVADYHYVVMPAYRALLETTGFRVNGHSLNGIDVINWVNSGENKSDVLLLDISMPILTGIEVLEYFKKTRSNKKHLLYQSTMTEVL